MRERGREREREIGLAHLIFRGWEGTKKESFPFFFFKEKNYF
jgi:hypothetical protein